MDKLVTLQIDKQISFCYVWNKDGRMKENDLFSVLFEEDSDGIHHNIPNAKYEKWEINSLGFRGKEIDLEKKEGQIRIACFGVSETFGVYESKDKEWPSQLLSTYPALITSLTRDIDEDILLLTRLLFCIELSEHGIMDASRKSNDTVRRIAKEQDLILVDNDRLIPKTLEYFVDSFHYTDKGAEFIARNFYCLLDHYGLIE